MCKEEGCNEKPIYNYKIETKGEYCKLHKKDKMIDIRQKSRICLEKECVTRAGYNFKAEKKGLYCIKHKEENMINVKNKKCKKDGCEIVPNYNYKGETKGLYCFEHKEEDMINVKSKKCTKEGCLLEASYNYKGTIKRLYCSEHKEEGMINIASKMCQKEGCNITATFNYEGIKKRLYCSEHKKEGMIEKNHKKCSEEGCQIIPCYNYEGEKKGLYCTTHKKEKMIYVNHPKCKSEWCYTIVNNERYKGYCLFCFMNIFPNEPVAKNYKTKEKTTVDFILKKFPDFTWKTDKKVQDGCSRRRPDLLLDLGYQVIIVEIDENQHDRYDCSCENKRIMQISQDVGHRPIIFIRFNPDDYLKGEETITSCWSLNGKGIYTIDKIKKKEWNVRLKSLKKQVDYWCKEENKTDKTIEIVQLFYDQ